MSVPIALLVADLHLCHKPPSARSVEPDWYAAMARPLRQLRAMAAETGASILCAGDIFEKWNSPPELINWAIENLPKMFAVPGQHDLPLHDAKQIKRSAYWTLVEAGTIVDSLTPDPIVMGMGVYGFPFGEEITPPKDESDRLKVALIHSYAQQFGKGYPNAPRESLIFGYKEKLEGYDVAVFGDNHQTFRTRVGETCVVNCGCLIPRKLNERNYEPVIYVLFDDGCVEERELDTSEDRWVGPEESAEFAWAETLEFAEGLSEFVEDLKSLECDSLDFRSAMYRYLDSNRVTGPVRKAVLEAMG